MIYWDHNASAPLRPEVAELVARRAREAVEGAGNASSVHGAGRRARARLDAARAQVAKVLRCEPKEVCFTASGSEAGALALKGAWAAVHKKEPARRKVVLSAVEHPSLLGAGKQLGALGAEVVEVRPRADGRVDAGAMLEAVDERTAVCSLMWANNETGVLQPVAEVARGCRAKGVRFHADAVQAAGKVPVAMADVEADLLSLSAHKLGGPPGAGALVVRRGVDLEALVPGHQEHGRRGGTQDVTGAEALALALELAAGRLEETAARVAALRDRFERLVRERLDGVHVNGEGAPRVPNTSNLRFDGADGEALLIALDLEGICVSSGAACASGSLSPSHVLLAMGLSSAQAHASLRFSLGPGSTEAEVDRVVDAL
ncbi:MAG TPA: cysteine desulfurase family protein, partial [Myxococcales bacterium]|nr:cysteine desulfurase family protein [Myxococcales bacterium]